MMKQLPWLPCFKPSRKTGRKRKKRCHSRCLPLAGFIFCIVVFYLMNTVHLSSHIRIYFSAQVIHRNPRGPGFGAHGGKPHMPINDRPLPPSYVCYRCGQKGSPYLPLETLCIHLLSRPLDSGLSYKQRS